MNTLRVDAESLMEAFSDDARISAFVMPYVLQRHGYAMVKNKGGGWLVQKNGTTRKIRAMTRDGVNFGPSVSKGAGRHHSEGNWQDGESSIDGFLVFDSVTCGKEVLVLEVSVNAINNLRDLGVISQDGFLPRSQISRLTAPRH